MKYYSHILTLFLGCIFAGAVASCEGEVVKKETSTHEGTRISVEEALEELSRFQQRTATRSESRQIESVDVTYDNDNLPIAYLINYSDSKGFAVLSADSRTDIIIAAIDSGSMTWDKILNSSRIPINDGSSEYEQKLIAQLIKNGLFAFERIGQTRDPGNGDPEEEGPRVPPPGGWGGGGGTGGGGNGNTNVYVAPLTSDCLFGQTRTYCHKNNGGYVLCGCAATAMAIVSAYHQFPSITIDGESFDYANCNLKDGIGIKYTFPEEDYKSVYFPIQDYFYDYLSIPINSMSDSAKIALITRIDNNIVNVHGTPLVSEDTLLRSRYKLCAAIFDTLSCAITSWDATGALPGDVNDGLDDLGYASADYWTHSDINDHLDSLCSMLRQNKPVIMGGWSLWDLSDSHYWVVDGIDKNSATFRIHCNWGWNGYLNGWFSQYCINPNVGVPYDGGSTVNGIDSITTWNHMILYRYDIPSGTVTRHLHPTMRFKTYYYE